MQMLKRLKDVFRVAANSLRKSSIVYVEKFVNTVNTQIYFNFENFRTGCFEFHFNREGLFSAVGTANDHICYSSKHSRTFYKFPELSASKHPLSVNILGCQTTTMKTNS